MVYWKHSVSLLVALIPMSAWWFGLNLNDYLVGFAQVEYFMGDL
jgi:uncharacterized membrane protein